MGRMTWWPHPSVLQSYWYPAAFDWCLRTGPLLCSSSTIPYGMHMTIRAGVPAPLLQPHGSQDLPPLNIRHPQPRAALYQLSIQLPPNIHLVSSEGNPDIGQCMKCWRQDTSLLASFICWEENTSHFSRLVINMTWTLQGLYAMTFCRLTHLQL
jgi:hypothetical protein